MLSAQFALLLDYQPEVTLGFGFPIQMWFQFDTVVSIGARFSPRGRGSSGYAVAMNALGVTGSGSASGSSTSRETGRKILLWSLRRSGATRDALWDCRSCKRELDGQVGHMSGHSGTVALIARL